MGRWEHGTTVAGGRGRENHGEQCSLFSSIYIFFSISQVKFTFVYGRFFLFFFAHFSLFEFSFLARAKA